MKPELLDALRRLGKSWYTIRDLQKITGLARPSLRVFLSRWTKVRRLERVRQGVYRLPGAGLDLERFATDYYFPAYLSFESALARYGILSQVPYALTFATTRRSRRLRLAEAEIEYRQVRPDLFFGFEQEGGVYVARPEKALLDQLYMATRGRARLELEALNLRPLRQNILRRYARAYPDAVRTRLRSIGLE